VSVASPQFENEHLVLRRVTWRLSTYLLIGQVLLQLDKTNVGFAQLTMGRDLALSAGGFGLASGAFSLAVLLFQLPSSKLLAIFGVRRWLTANMLLWGCTCIAEAFVRNGAQLIALRFLLGIFEAAAVPGWIVLVNRWFRQNKHGQTIGILGVAVAVAGLVGGPLAGWLLHHMFFGLAGWRNVFLWEGAATLGCAAVSLTVLYDCPASAPWLNNNERKFIEDHIATEHSGLVDTASRPDNVYRWMSDWRIYFLAVSFFCAGWINGILAFFSPTLLQMAGRGVSVQTVGLLSLGPSLIQGIVSVTWGRDSDRRGKRHWHLLGALAAGAAGALLYPMLSGHALLTMMCLMLVQGAMAGFVVTFWPTVNLVVGRTAIIKVAGVILTASQLGHFLSPIVFGRLLDAYGQASLGLELAAAVLVLNCAVMGAFFYFGPCRKNPARASLPSIPEGAWPG
jgi:ACS family tartrate transporter-like MFS transporter